MDILQILADQIIGSAFGAGIGVAGKSLYDRYRAVRTNKRLATFFHYGRGERYHIIHSALFDDIKQEFTYPANDVLAVRILSSILDTLRLREDTDYFVYSDVHFKKHFISHTKEIANNNLILICSPKGNSITGSIMQSIPNLRYRSEVDIKTNDAYLVDEIRKTDLRSFSNGELNVDYAVIINATNPFNPLKQALLLFGNQGVGTAGAARFLLEPRNVDELLKRKKNGIIQELLTVKYKSRHSIIDVSLS